MTTETSDRIQREIARLAHLGRTGPQICQEMRITWRRYAYHRQRAFERGLHPVGSANPYKLALRLETKRGRRPGLAADLWRSLGADAVRWLLQECPTETPIMEFIAAIVRDAYNEETEQCSTTKK